MIGIIKKPNIEEKLDLLTASARHDVCLASCNGNSFGGTGRLRDPGNPLTRWIYPAQLPGKGLVRMLKVLQTNVCKNNCSYCAFSADRDTIMRTGFAPHELADTFIQFVQRRLVHGIFISSGVRCSADSAMERMLHTVEILRNKHKFKGYIHLKLLPGVSFNLIERAAQLADRVSMNLEAPTRKHLEAIAPDKNFVDDLMRRMKWAGELIQKGSYTKSQTTQFVVGASAETDQDILKTIDWIYRKLYVFRAYFSAFQPDAAHDRSINNNTLLREHRLYQSDFLLRGYGFRFRDLVFDENDELPREVDPKTAYAVMHPELYPIDINTAAEEELLKVPGIGPLSAGRIVETRRKDSFHGLNELKRVGAVIKWAAPYIEFSGKREKGSSLCYTQRWLFDELASGKWRTGFQPYQKEKLESGKPFSETPANPYEYPGQKGKRLAFAPFGSKSEARCR